jgi:hypothetical protein
MPKRDAAKYKNPIDKLADAAMPKFDARDVSERGGWWWIFIMPGKVILWIEYMFPKRLGNVFGSARRRNVPLLQVVYSIGFYIAVVMFIIVAAASTR